MLLFAAAFLLLLNDHVLKGAAILPGIVTGKLSDFCGLFVLPIVIARVSGMQSRRAHALICAACAVAFAIVKTTVLGNAIYRAVLGSTLIDPTDLVALPSAFVAYFALRTPARDRVSLVLAAIGCIATSAQHPPQEPRAPDHPPAALAQGTPCAIVTPSGVEPHGDEAIVHFDAKNSGPVDCEVSITARLDAKTSVPNTEVNVNGKTTITVAANSAADIGIPLRGVYPIVCTGDPTVGFDVIETPSGGQEFRTGGGGRVGCWHSTVLAP